MKKSVKIVVSLLLTLCMLMPMATMVFAAGDSETASVYTGEKNNPDDWDVAAWQANYKAGGEFTIDSAYELMTFAQAGLSFKADATVKLTTDIVINEGNAEDWETTPPTVGWTPIASFKGTFDGQGHTISGIYLEQTANFQGFFAQLGGTTTIQNLGLTNSLFVNPNQSWYLGAFMGRPSYVDLTMTNCYTDAIVKSTGGNGYLGGFSGLASAHVLDPDSDSTTTPKDGVAKEKVLMENCVFAGRIEGGAYRGGFFGYGQNAGGTSDVTFNNCVNMGIVKSGSGAGAFVSVINTVTLKNCINLDPSVPNLVANLADVINTTPNAIASVTVEDCYFVSDYGTQTVFYTAPEGFSEEGAVTSIKASTIDASILPAYIREHFGDELSIEAGLGRMSVYAELKDPTNVNKIINVDNAGELLAVSQLINDGSFGTRATGYTFKLTADITFNEGENAEDWATNAPAFSWTPIQNFSGTFDGQGHTISGIYYQGTKASSFFGFINVLREGGTFKNVGFINSFFTGPDGSYTPTIIGRVNQPTVGNEVNITISGVYSEAIVKGQNAGGIVCLVTNVDETFTISDCVFAGKLIATGFAGGIVQQGGMYLNADKGVHPVNVTNCANYGTITAGKAGAIVGAASKVNMTNCANFGIVTSINENYRDNALIAYMSGDNNTVVQKCTVSTVIFSDLNQVVIGEAADETTFDSTINVTKAKAISAIGKELFASGWTSRFLDYPLPTYIYEKFGEYLGKIEIPDSGEIEPDIPEETEIFDTFVDDGSFSIYTGSKNNSSDWTKQDWINNFSANRTNLTIDSAYELVTFAQASASITFTNDTKVTVTTNIALNRGDARQWSDGDVSGLFAFPGITGFKGTFNGNGKTVSGVYFPYTGTSNGSGFFNTLTSGTTVIKDFALVNSLFTTSTSNYSPTFIGRINSTANVTLSGLYSNAIIVHTGDVSNAGTGGIVSLVTPNEGYAPTIKGCVFDGCIDAANGTVGGIIGLVGVYQLYFEANVEDCVNYGALFGTTVGGIVGIANRLNINRCINYTGEDLVGKIATKVTVSGVEYSQYLFKGSNNYLFNGQCINRNAYITGNNGTISEVNKGDGAKALTALDFTNVWTARQGDYPVPKNVYNNFGKWFGLTETNIDTFVDDGYYKNNTFYQKMYKAEVKKQIEDGVKTFIIYNEDQLVAIAELINDAEFVNSAAGITFKLNRNMVFNKGNAANWRTTAPTYSWTPIKVFRGTFDGQGYNISGLYYVGESNNNNAGLFGILYQGATVKDLGVVNSYMQFTNQYGNSVIGRINGGNVTVSGIYTDMIIDANVISATGGIVGFITNTGNNYVLIENCVFAGTINALDGNAGAIVGCADISRYSDVVIRNCANYGTVYVASVAGVAGGIIGVGSSVTLDNCLNAGVVNSKNYAYLDGALVGSISAEVGSSAVQSLTATNCYNTSDVMLCDPSSYSTSAKPTTLKETDKGDQLFNSDWASLSKYVEDEYPLPTDIYENFFRTDVKYIQSSPVNNGTYSIRFIAEVDSLNYSKAGFNVKVTLTDGTTRSLTTNETKVYKTIVSGEGETYNELSALKDRYFVALTITDMPTTVKKYEVTPYTIGDLEEYAYGITKTLIFDENGNFVTSYDNSVYKLIYNTSDSAILPACYQLSTALNNLSGINSKLFVDSSIAVDESTYEILIGDTNRPESIAAKNALNGERYSITQNGNKIVIVASNKLALEDAVIYFTDNLKSTGEGAFDYPKNYQSAEYKTVEIVSDGTANYRLGYTDFYNNINYHSGNYNSTLGRGENGFTIGFTENQAKNELLISLNALTGAAFTSTDEASSTDSYKDIIVGKPNGDNNENFDYYENGVYFDGKDIYIYGHNQDDIANAVKNFVARIERYKTLVGGDNYVLLCNADGFKWSDNKVKYDVPLPDGLTWEGVYAAADSGRYLIYEDCTQAQFNAYCNKLTAAGFEKYFDRQASTNLFAGFYLGDDAAWVYYIADRKEMRVVFETYRPLPDFGNEGAKVQEGYVTQMGVDETTNSTHVLAGHGMGYIIGLEDGRYVVIDGLISYYTDKDVLADKFYNYMKDNNKHPSGEIVIAAWIITHGHVDHYDNFNQFGKKYGAEVNCQYIIHNLPTQLSLWGAANAGGDTYIDGTYNKMDRNFKSAVSYTVHTGYDVTIGGVYLEFMSTYEDVYNHHDVTVYSIDSTQTPHSLDQMNDSSLTFRFTFNKGDSDEATIFFLGDNYFDHGERLASMWDASYMKSDAVQLAHHGYNNGVMNGHEKTWTGGAYISNTYKEIAAEYAFCPGPNDRITTSSGPYIVMNAANSAFNISKVYFNDQDGVPTDCKMTFDGGISVTVTPYS